MLWIPLKADDDLYLTFAKELDFAVPGSNLYFPKSFLIIFPRWPIVSLEFLITFLNIASFQRNKLTIVISII